MPRTAPKADCAADRHDFRPDLLRPDRQGDGDGNRQDRGQREDGSARVVELVDHDAADGGPGPEPERAAGGEDPHRQPEPVTRRDVADRGHHHAAVAQLEPDEHHPDHELPGRPAGGDDAEHDRFDERTPDDHRFAAVLVRPDAPERDQRQTGQEEHRPEDPDEMRDVRRRHADLAEPVRHEGIDLGDSEAFDERCDPVDGQERAPIRRGSVVHASSLSERGGWSSAGRHSRRSAVRAEPPGPAPAREIASISPSEVR